MPVPEANSGVPDESSGWINVTEGGEGTRLGSDDGQPFSSSTARVQAKDRYLDMGDSSRAATHSVPGRPAT
jgi:hypothetical protein